VDKFDDRHAAEHGFRIDRDAFHFPPEEPQRLKSRKRWLLSQRAKARARGLKVVSGVIR
jgi:hypothetical protein